MLNDKQCRSRSVGLFKIQLIWICTVCKGRAYLGSAGLGLSGLKVYLFGAAPINRAMFRSRKPNEIPCLWLFIYWPCRPRWLSWMRRPTEDQEVAGSTPAEVDNILSWRLIMKYFLRSFSPFRWFMKGSCQFLAKECAQYWLTALRTKPAQ